MRRANRESLLHGNFAVITDHICEEQGIIAGNYKEGEAPELEQFILGWVSSRLNEGRPVDPAISLTAYGIDSIMAVELTAETKNVFGFEWPPYLFFEEISITVLVGEGLKLMEER